MAKVFILARWTTGVFCDASTPTRISAGSVTWTARSRPKPGCSFCPATGDVDQPLKRGVYKSVVALENNVRG
jgi:hypothetical protein